MVIICTIIAIFSPLRTISTILALIHKECSKFELVMGILALPLAVFFYGNLLGFTFSVAFEFAAFIGLMALTGDVLTAVVIDFVKSLRK